MICINDVVSYFIPNIDLNKLEKTKNNLNTLIVLNTFCINKTSVDCEVFLKKYVLLIKLISDDEESLYIKKILNSLFGKDFIYNASDIAKLLEQKINVNNLDDFIKNIYQNSQYQKYIYDFGYIQNYKILSNVDGLDNLTYNGEIIHNNTDSETYNNSTKIVDILYTNGTTFVYYN